MPVEHAASGALVGSGTTLVGVGRRSIPHVTSGTMVGAGAAVTGASARSVANGAATLFDNFDAGTIDTSKWSPDVQPGVSLTQSGGTLNFDLGTATTYGSCWSRSPKNMTGGRFFAKFVQPPQGMAGVAWGCEVAMRITDFGAPAKTLDITWGTNGTTTGQISVDYDPGTGTWTRTGARAFVAATHTWWSVRESSGSYIIETAPVTAANPPNTSDWVNFATLSAAAFPMSPVSVNVAMTAIRMDPAIPYPTGPAKFDGFNTTANSATVHATSGVLTGSGAVVVGASAKGNVAHATSGALVGAGAAIVGAGSTTAVDHRPTPVPSGWLQLYWRDYSLLNAISLNAGSTEAMTTGDKGEYKAGAAFYRDWRSFGIAGYGHDVFTDPLVTGQLPAEYQIARPLGEIEPVPGVGIRLHARPSTGANMNAAIATWFPAAIDLANSMATTVWTTGQLTTFTKISARPPFARVTYFIPRTDYAQKTFLAAMWSTEDGNREWPNDTLHSPFEYDDHEFLGNGTAGKASSVSVHIYGSPGYSTPIKNGTIGNYNPPGGTFVNKTCGVLTVFDTADIKTYMNVDGGAWTLVATTTLTSISGSEYDQYHIAFIHDVSAGYPWEGTAGAATTPLSCDIVRVGLFAPSTNTNVVVPTRTPPSEVTLTWRSGFNGNIPINTPVGTAVADLNFPAEVVSASVITYAGRLTVAGTELRVGAALDKTGQPTLRFHIQGVKADGAKSIGRQWAATVGASAHNATGSLTGAGASLAGSASHIAIASSGALSGKVATVSAGLLSVVASAAPVRALFAGSAQGVWLTPLPVGNFETLASGGVPLTAYNTQYGKWRDVSGNGNDALEPVLANRGSAINSSGWKYAGMANDDLDIANIGGSTTAFYFAAAMALRTYYGTIYSDQTTPTAANGFRIYHTSDGDGVNQKIGFCANGAAYDLVNSYGRMDINTGLQAILSWPGTVFANPVSAEIHVVEFWYDGTRLYGRIDGGPVAQSASTITVNAGSTAVTLNSNKGTDFSNGGTDYYEVVQTKNFLPSAAQRDAVLAYLAGRINSGSARGLTGHSLVASKGVVGTVAPTAGSAALAGFGLTSRHGAVGFDSYRPLTGASVTTVIGSMATDLSDTTAVALTGLEVTASRGALGLGGPNWRRVRTTQRPGWTRHRT